MSINKNAIKKDFSFVYRVVLMDATLSSFDRGLLVTLINLPDDWSFSVSGLCTILPDGKSAISGSLRRLEDKGYIRLIKDRNERGLFETTLELCIPSGTREAKPCPIAGDGQMVTDKPSPSVHPRLSATDYQSQYKKQREQHIKRDDNQSIILSLPEKDRKKDRTMHEDEEHAAYRKIVATNIHLDWLKDAAERSGDSAEVDMVNEIYALICDIVCYPHGDITIHGTAYPWQVVKKQFLSLKYSHVASVLHRVVDQTLGIQNMRQYLISTLYNESLCGTIKCQADLHDDYLMSIRGEPYAI